MTPRGLRSAGRMVRLCEADPDLLGGAGLRHPLANRELDLIRLESGRWTGAERLAELGLGLLVIDGLLVRRVGLGERRRSELLGIGDLVRPWEREEPFGSLSLQVDWEVMASARLAVLDADFVRAAAVAPDVLAALAVRAVRRSQRLACSWPSQMFATSITGCSRSSGIWAIVGAG